VIEMIGHVPPEPMRRIEEEILAEIDAVPIPRLEKAARKDKKAVSEFVTKLQLAEQRRRSLIRALWKADPDEELAVKHVQGVHFYTLKNATTHRSDRPDGQHCCRHTWSHQDNCRWRQEDRSRSLRRLACEISAS